MGLMAACATTQSCCVAANRLLPRVDSLMPVDQVSSMLSGKVRPTDADTYRSPHHTGLDATRWPYGWYPPSIS